ncbi:MAG: hypothetical protein V4689_05150 [Verrucomicrobiota bacterium]
MNALLEDPDTLRPAHTLFPPDQPLLWLPGFPGEEVPYCSYNGHRADPTSSGRGLNLLPQCDRNGAFYHPPYPVSPETHITWHTNVSPPYPFHPVPLARSLSPSELADVAHKVIELMEEAPEVYPDPIKVLRNQYKPYIVATLARMRLLPERTHALHPV